MQQIRNVRAVKGRLVLVEVFLCSVVLRLRVREVDPTCVVPHNEQLNLYTTDERNHKGSLSSQLNEEPILKLFFSKLP